MAWREDVSTKLYDITGGILGTPTKPVMRKETAREKLIKEKQYETREEQKLRQQTLEASQPQTGRYQLTLGEALIPGVDMGGKYQRRTPEQLAAAQDRQSKLLETGGEGVSSLIDRSIEGMQHPAQALVTAGQDLWKGGVGNRQVTAPVLSAFTPEVPTENIGKTSVQDVAKIIIKNNTTEELNLDRGLPEDAPSPAETTYGAGDGITTDKAGKATPTTADDDVAQNNSASQETSKNLENTAVKADDDTKVGQGVLGDATKSWWFNVTDTMGDALMNYGIAYSASGGDKGKAFASAGQTISNGFDKYDRRQQINDLKGKGYSDAEIMNYINSGQLAKPIMAGAGKGKALTEAQMKAKGGAFRADFVNKTWGKKYGKLTEGGKYPITTTSSQVRGLFDEDGFARKVIDIADPEYAKAFKDETGFLAGVLRPESGSAIGKMEWDTYGHIYFPRYGDDPEDIARKNLLRQMTIKTLQAAGDPTDAEAEALAREMTKYSGQVVKYDVDEDAYLLDNGNYLVL